MTGPPRRSFFLLRSSLGFPDAWRIDRRRGWLDRIGYTWDGTPISSEPPYGTAVLVYRRRDGKIEFLLLHLRASSGDWAWTPPAGARLPGEDVVASAMRELEEETGLKLPIVASEFGDRTWPQFLAMPRSRSRWSYRPSTMSGSGLGRPKRAIDAFPQLCPIQ